MKKGYVYTLAILLFLGVLITLVSVNELRASGEVNNRLSSMNDFLLDFEQDAKRAVFIAGFRSFIALEQEVARSGEYFDTLNPYFVEAFTNGTIDGQQQLLLEDATFGEYLSRTQQYARTTGLVFDVQILEVTLEHTSPWEVVVDYRLRIILSDLEESIRWDYEKTFSAPISVLDLQDPFYSVETENKAPNTIRLFTQEPFIIASTNDTSTLELHLNESSYRPSTNAPSFLQRFEGNNSPHQYGIQSLVNLEKLSAQGVPVFSDRSVVDYQYFFEPASQDYCFIQNMPVYFVMDSQNYLFYELDKIDTSPC